MTSVLVGVAAAAGTLIELGALLFLRRGKLVRFLAVATFGLGLPLGAAAFEWRRAFERLASASAEREPAARASQLAHALADQLGTGAVLATGLLPAAVVAALGAALAFNAVTLRRGASRAAGFSVLAAGFGGVAAFSLLVAAACGSAVLLEVPAVAWTEPDQLHRIAEGYLALLASGETKAAVALGLALAAAAAALVALAPTLERGPPRPTALALFGAGLLGAGLLVADARPSWLENEASPLPDRIAARTCAERPDRGCVAPPELDGPDRPAVDAPELSLSSADLAIDGRPLPHADPIDVAALAHALIPPPPISDLELSNLLGALAERRSIDALIDPARPFSGALNLIVDRGVPGSRLGPLLDSCARAGFVHPRLVFPRRTTLLRPALGRLEAVVSSAVEVHLDGAGAPVPLGAADAFDAVAERAVEARRHGDRVVLRPPDAR
jgi:hypothetical protein